MMEAEPTGHEDVDWAVPHEQHVCMTARPDMIAERQDSRRKDAVRDVLVGPSIRSLAIAGHHIIALGEETASSLEAQQVGLTQFEILLKHLQCEHDEEVAHLRAEIATLHALGGGMDAPLRPAREYFSARTFSERQLPASVERPPRATSKGSGEGGGQEQLQHSAAPSPARSRSTARSSSSVVRAATPEAAATAAAVGGGPKAPMHSQNSQDSASPHVPRGRCNRSSTTFTAMRSSNSLPAAGHRNSATKAHLRQYMQRQDSERGPPLSLQSCLHCLRHMLNGPFEAIVGAAIVLNVVVAFTLIELKGRANGTLIGMATYDDTSGTQETLAVALNAFTVFFTLELILKLLCFGRELFWANGVIEWFGVFDATIVLLSIIDALVTLLTDAEASSNFAVLRSLRLIRVLRVVRIARTLKAFTSLRVLVSAVFASFFALFWSMVLLGVVMMVAALFLSQAVSDVVEDPSYSDDLREWAYRYYGTSSRAIWTVFELTFSGGWPNYARRLVEEVSAAFAVFFAFYVSSVTFAMFRIITALFLKDTLRVASLDIDNSIQEVLAEKRHYAQKLTDFFEAADVSGDGVLSLEEFDAVLADERLRAYLATMGIDAHKMRQMFFVLDVDEGGSISMDDFVKGAIRLKGTARSQDIAAVLKETESMHEMMLATQAAILSLHQALVGGSVPLPMGVSDSAASVKSAKLGVYNE